jgi:hypothetical protein
MRRPAGGGPTSFWDVGVLDSGGPNFSFRIVKVETRAGEVVRASALHAHAIALLAIVGHGPHLVLLEAKFLSFGELLFSFAPRGPPESPRSRSHWRLRGEGFVRRYFIATHHEDGDWVLIVRGVD